MYVSCFCNGVSICCQCFTVKELQFSLPAVDKVDTTDVMTHHSDVVVQNTNDASQICTQPLDSCNDTQLIGQFCVVKYNGKPYPGKILAVDETHVTVSCMHGMGTKNTTLIVSFGQTSYQISACIRLLILCHLFQNQRDYRTMVLLTTTSGSTLHCGITYRLHCCKL